MPVNDEALICEIIRQGEFVSCELTPAGSNYTFLAQLKMGDQTSLAIYKPRDGESPLWDFPRATLYKREYGAYLLSQILGWDFIPFTIIRDGPYGIGTVQLFIDHDPKQNYYTLSDHNLPQLKTVALFDLVANSTDRKPNHLILDGNGRMWSIDHGLKFHADTKIRTVIWDFSAERIPKRLLSDLRNLAKRIQNPDGQLSELLELLQPEEVAALERRIEWVLSEGVYPGVPGGYRRRSR